MNEHKVPLSSWSVSTSLQRGAASLAATSREPRRDAELLLRHVLHQERSWLLAHPEHLLMGEQQQAFEEALNRRSKHEPMQYILGEQDFYGQRLRVSPAVLIPRPETEHLVEAVLARLPRERPVRIADVGTGSGAIALALAYALPLAAIDALDTSREALAVAEENARALDLTGRVSFHHSELLSAVAGQQYDCIVSNPPYVTDTDTLEPQVALWEPHSALFAGHDGLDIYRRLLPQAAKSLTPGGLFAGELGAGQREALTALFREDPRWSEPTFIPDLQGISRVALATTRLDTDQREGHTC